MISILKLIKKNCPDTPKCAYYKNNQSSEQIKNYCKDNYKKCARYYLTNIEICDCVDDNLEPQDMEKAIRVLKVTEYFRSRLDQEN